MGLLHLHVFALEHSSQSYFYTAGAKSLRQQNIKNVDALTVRSAADSLREGHGIGQSDDPRGLLSESSEGVPRQVIRIARKK
jgi:hypothetical protein